MTGQTNIAEWHSVISITKGRRDKEKDAGYLQTEPQLTHIIAPEDFHG